MKSCRLRYEHSTGRLVCLMALAAALLGCVIPQAASAASGFALSKTAVPYAICPEPSSSADATCEAIAVPTVAASSAEATGPELEGSGEKGGFNPKDLHEAYKLPEKGGKGTTIAIVDAYNDPYAQSDLEKYREKYKVYYESGVTACTEANGCFKKVNQKGETKNYPENEPGWAGEISLDLDMVSAACPECKILLVEAKEEGISNLGPSDEEAEKLGATVISNSWNKGFEGTSSKEVDSTEEAEYNKYFDHEKVPILFSGGDYGYSVRYPAVSQYVIAVGGTKLKKTSEGSRKWSEEVWSNTEYGYREKGRGTGSGCSKYEPKPKWQTDKPCTHRIQNDVAAVAAPESPVSVYDTYESGWANSGGTSASAPFVAGVEGLSTSHSRALKADAFYVAKSSLFDVTKGNNGTCTPPTEDEYFCTAEIGYDGPTGNGAPDAALATGPSATTEAATAITKTGATLNGTVNPEGVETKYYFEYGTSEAYGNKTAEASAGSGTSNVKESQAITGLTAGKQYDYRIVATNSNKETSYGANRVFSTLPNAPENTVLPVASPATPDQAVPESTTTGTWTNNPTSYAYQWELCNSSGIECKEIPGATSSTYTPVEANVGDTLAVKVTAKNSGGEGSAHSKATNQVQPIGRITEYSLPSESGPKGITAGPDGNLWFVDHDTQKIGKITTSGTITEYSLPSGSYPYDIVAGPDGDLWFTEFGNGKIGKITTSGTVTEYSLSSSSSEPTAITVGSDGNLWFTEYGTEKIGKITTSGTITEYGLPSESGPWQITAGPD
ncbi:MAG: virginiamycin B lyase family protein, partial [Solirubrobacteraceae bacterium]